MFRRSAPLVGFVVACVLTGFSVLDAPRAAFADATFAVVDLEMIPGPGQTGVRINLSAPMSADRHPVRVVLPDPLSSLYSGALDAVCTGPHNDLTCTPNYPTTTSFVILVYNADISMDGTSYVVTATDLVTSESRSGTVRVRAHSDVELQYLGVTEIGSGPRTVDAFVMNRGPSATVTTTLQETFTGDYSIQQLPPGCSLAGATVTCQLGPLRPTDYVRPSIVLAKAPGRFSVTGVVESSSLETDPSDNSQGPVFYGLAPAGPPPSYVGGGPGGQPPAGAPDPVNSAAPTAGASTDPSPTMATPAPGGAPEAQPVAATQPRTDRSLAPLFVVSAAVVIAALGAGGYLMVRRRRLPVAAGPPAEDRPSQ